MASVTLYPRADSYTPVWLSDSTGFTTASPGYLGGSGSAGIFYRSSLFFQPAAIPQGSTINSAVLTLTAVNNLAGTTVNLAIYGNDTDSPSVVTSAGAGNAKVLTSAYVQWSPAAWTADVSYDSPDLSTIIQEIVDRSGFGSYNYIHLLVRDNGTTDKDANRDYYNYNTGSAAYYPKLVIEFSPPSAGTYTLTSLVDADDGEWTPFIASSDHMHSNYDGGSRKDLFLRFPNVYVPKESTIISAYLKLTSYGTGNAKRFTIYGNDVDYAEYPVDSAGANALTLTTASVVWNTETVGYTGYVYTTPNISSIIQEIINRTDWGTGNPIQLKVDENIYPDTGGIVVCSVSHATAAYWPQLVITYAASVPTFTGDATVSLPALTIGTSATVLEAFEGDLEVTLPALQFLGWATVKEGNACIFPALTCEATGKLGEIIEVSLPALTISALGAQLNTATGAFDLSIMTCSAYSGMHGDVDVDLPLITMTGRTGEGLSVSFPVITCSSTGLIGNTGKVVVTLPALAVSSPGYAGLTGAGSITFGIMTCSASSYTVPVGTLSSSLSVAFLRATGFNSDRFASTVLRYTRP